ncbi:MAG: putative lipid II flippase FtsW [Oscillospiraceae bacterium]|nr:putative lipid II flippase FtsW [Oscillospiraceae bacterium]
MSQDENIQIIDLKKAKKELERPVRGPMDIPFMLLVILLCSIGLVMMFSASYATGADDPDLGPAFFVTRQSVYALLGVCIMLAISKMNHHYFRLFAIPVMLVALALLVVVLFIGSDAAGAKRWINFGFFNLQPSEVAKVAVILLFAQMISMDPEGLTHKKLLPAVKGIWKYIGILALVVGLIILEPHFSGTVIIIAIGAVMMFVGGIATRWIVAVGGMAVSLLYLIITQTNYAKARLDIWKDPFSDMQGDGWQTVQSLYAIGSGGPFGVGLGQSRQKHLYLPEPQNDFVFSIVCEELGLVGAGVVLMLFMLLIIRGYWIAIHSSHDRFGMLLCSGITSLLAVQTFLNVAVVTNLIPVTGISMPFFSYGGSSLVLLMAQMGVILSVSREIKPGIAGD